mgnify:CR=1 FL=1
MSDRSIREALTIQTAADYFRTSRASKAFVGLLRAIKRIFTFAQERANRLRRCVEIIHLYAKGVPVRDIVDRYGCSNNTVLRYARAAGLPKRPKHFPEKVRLAALHMYKDGRPLAEIEARLGVSKAYVSKLATEEGINRNRPITADDRKLIAALYKADVPLKDITERSGRDRRTIWKIAKEAGLQLRKGAH